MKITNKILIAILMCMPLVAWGTVTQETLQAIENAESVETAKQRATEALTKSKQQYPKANNTNIILRCGT